MIQVCYYCHQVYGEKEPLQNKEETHGECDLCHSWFRIWLQRWRAGVMKQTASEFIAEQRKAPSVNLLKEIRP